jgi:signal-transduction protein with cAMP-binding, CBS, and nucleotidyltransferase domain
MRSSGVGEVYQPFHTNQTTRPRSGEAAVTQGGKEVNRLFKADFFGERALLSNEPRGATVAAVQDTVCISLDRDTFVEILGPMDSVMKVRVCGGG